MANVNWERLARATGIVFVVLALSGYAITFGDNTVCAAGFGTTADAITLGRVQVGTLDGTGTNREEHSIAMLFTLPVSGGTNTFFINAQKPSGFSAATVNLSNVFAAALFVPKRY